MRKQIGSPQIRKAYSFLREMETNGTPFTFEELRVASGWSRQTARANVSKKLNRFLTRAGGNYEAVGLSAVSEEAFCKTCSQSSALSGDPLKPILDLDAEAFVVKARESVIAAVQHYNNPTATFRSGIFISNVVIGFTALFHAVFERDGIDYVARNNDGTAKMSGAQPTLWELSGSASEYFRMHAGKYTPAVVAAATQNIQFLLPIRHKIEHRQMPQIDAEIAGHCQSMLHNFEHVLVSEFTSYYSLSSCLSLAMQFSRERPSAMLDALRSIHAAEYAELKQHINDFHAGPPDEIMGHPAFALRMWLVPKPAKHARASDMTIEFVHLDQANREQMQALGRALWRLAA